MISDHISTTMSSDATRTLTYKETIRLSTSLRKSSYEQVNAHTAVIRNGQLHIGYLAVFYLL